MLGFLSTHNTPLARQLSGPAVDGGADSADRKGSMKTGTKSGSSNFLSTFSKTGSRPDVAVRAAQSSDADKKRAQDESVSDGVPDPEDVGRVESGSVPDTYGEEAGDAIESGQLDPVGILEDPAANGSLEPQANGAIFAHALQEDTSGSRIGPIGPDMSKTGQTQPAPSPTNDPFKGDATYADSDTAEHVRGFSGKSDAPVPTLPLALRGGPTLLSDGTVQADAGWALDPVNVASSDRDAIPKDYIRNTAMTSPYDAGRAAVFAAPDSMPSDVVAGVAEGKGDGHGVIALNDPVAFGDQRLSQTQYAEPRLVIVPGGGGPQTARNIAIQVSEAANVGKRSIDLALNQSELGRVRIVLTPSDGAMVVSVSAERQETLDMMRRHIDVLDQEFRDLGYGGTRFTFSRERGDAQQIGKDGSSEGSTADSAPPPVTGHDTRQTVHVATSDRLDLRL